MQRRSKAKPRLYIDMPELLAANSNCLVSEDTVVLLAAVGVGAIGLPEVVKGSEKDEILAERALEGRDGSLLVLNAWNSNAVAVSLPWPAGLGDDDTLATASLRDALGLVENELTGLLSGAATIEESVAVGSSVVGSLAKRWVGNHCNESVDGDDVSGVTSGLEEATSGANSSNNLVSWGSLVDKLVTDGDGVNDRPVVLCGLDDDVDLVGNISNVEHSSEDLCVLALSSGNDVLDLGAVGSVDTEKAVAIELLEVRLHLSRVLATTGIGVWGVDHSEAGRVRRRLGCSSGRRLGRAAVRGGSRAVLCWSRVGRRDGALALSGCRCLIGGWCSAGGSACGDRVAVLVDVDDDLRSSHGGVLVSGNDITLLVDVAVSAVDLRGGGRSERRNGEKTSLHVDWIDGLLMWDSMFTVGRPSQLGCWQRSVLSECEWESKQRQRQSCSRCTVGPMALKFKT